MRTLFSILCLLFLFACNEKTQPKPNLDSAPISQKTDSIEPPPKKSFYESYGIGLFISKNNVNGIDTIKVDGRNIILSFKMVSPINQDTSIHLSPESYHNEEGDFILKWIALETKGQYIAKINETQTGILSPRIYSFVSWEDLFKDCPNIWTKNNYWSDTLKTKAVPTDPSGETSYQTVQRQGHWVKTKATDYDGLEAGPPGWIQWRDNTTLLATCPTLLYM